MITTVPAATVASTQAARNWAANLRALATTQPGFADRVQSLAVSGEWLLARDGSLTLQPTAGKWFGGCSIPYRAGLAMMQTLDPRGTVLCFLAPTHAGEIRAALERTTAQQAVLVLQPDPACTRIALSCEDFTVSIESHRLYFVTGQAWADDLRQLFTDRPGLPTPQQFIKLPTAVGEVVDPLIAGSQTIFAATNNARTDRVRTLRDTPRAFDSVRSIAVIAGSKFGLWEDAGTQLAAALVPDGSVDLRRLDPDSPLYAGPLATAAFCATGDALVTADVARGDFPDVLAKDQPWVTWVTRGRIPNPAAAGPRDALLVADATWRDTAIKAGWDARRVDLAGFPTITPTPADITFDGWTVLADTVRVEQPKQLEDFSSHKLLWESIENELRTNPFALDDAASFLYKRCRAMNLDESTLDRRQFGDLLLTPAYQQGLVRALSKAGVNLRLYGAGWGEIDEFHPLAAGPIRDRSELTRALGTARRLMHVWPGSGAHPILAAGLPVLRRRVSLLDAFIRDAKSPRLAPQGPSPVPPLSLERVRSVLGT